MWNSSQNYPAKYRNIIERSFPQIKERVFGHWKFPPVLSASDYPTCDGDEKEEEFRLHCAYENLRDSDEDYEQGCEALALVEAFIDGMIYQLEKDKIQ